MTLAQERGEARAVLGAAWSSLPASLRTPNQFLGRHYAGCGATIGAMPKCDFACTGCYLGEDANRARPRPLDELKKQLRQIRAWLGPAGNVQLTDGEVSLREPGEVIELIASQKAFSVSPMFA